MQQTHHSNMSSVHAHVLIIVGITTRLENMFKKLTVKAVKWEVSHLRKNVLNTLKMSITLRFPGKRNARNRHMLVKERRERKSKASSKLPATFLAIL